VRAITRAIPRIVRVSSKRRNSVARELLVSLAPGDQALFYGEVVDRHREMGRVQVRLEQAPRRALVELGRQLTNLLDGVLHELFKKDVHSALRVGMVERCWKWLGGLRLSDEAYSPGGRVRSCRTRHPAIPAALPEAVDHPDQLAQGFLGIRVERLRRLLDQLDALRPGDQQAADPGQGDGDGGKC
jgi:hypothetical protein